MHPFRNKTPVRTYAGQAKASYKDYREDLAKDFNGRCGYTDCSHVWWAGGFWIDHFAPQNPKLTDISNQPKFDALKNEYSNLVYSCPQVNLAKSNKWASDDPAIPIKNGVGFVDPCEDLNQYFERDSGGKILPKSDNAVAEYMWLHLKLYLERYAVYWRIEKLIERIEVLIEYKNSDKIPEELKAEINDAISDLTEEHLGYLKYIQVNYSNFVKV